MKSLRFPKVTLLLSAALALSLVVGCDDDPKRSGEGEGEGEGEGGEGEGEGGEGEGEGAAQLPITEQQARERTLLNLRTNLGTAAEAVEFMGDTELMASMGALVAVEDEEDSPEPMRKDAEDVVDEAEGLKAEVDEMVDWLQDNVFVQAESSDETTVTYRLGTALCDELVDGSCGSRPDVPDSGYDEYDEYDDCLSPEEREDAIADCEEFLEEVPLRLRVTAPAEGAVDVTLLGGAAELETMTLLVHQDSLAYEVNLANTRDALQLVLDAVAEEEGEAQLPDVLQGVVRFGLSVEGEQQVKVTSTIVSTVKVEMTVEGEAYSVSLAPSTMELTANGVAKSMAVAFDLGAFDLSLPFQAVVDAAWEEQGREPEPWEYGEEGEGEDSGAAEAPVAPGQLKIHLDGLTASSNVVDANEAEEMNITGFGLGSAASWIKLNEAVLFSLDLNPDLARKLDLTITPELQPASEDDYEDEYLPKIAVQPGLDLSLLFKLQQVVDSFPEDFFPPEVLDETWNLLLDGSDQPTLRFLDEETDTRAFGLEMIAGKLTLGSTALDEPVVIEQGMCLATEIEQWDCEEEDCASGSGEESGHFLGRLFSETCP